jgi:hypothetical protein
MRAGKRHPDYHDIGWVTELFAGRWWAMNEKSMELKVLLGDSPNFTYRVATKEMVPYYGEFQRYHLAPTEDFYPSIEDRRLIPALANKPLCNNYTRYIAVSKIPIGATLCRSCAKRLETLQIDPIIIGLRT